MKFRKLTSVLAALIVMASLLAACGAPAATQAPQQTDKVYIPVISKGFQHQFWQAVKKGSEQAAADLGVEITFEGPESEAMVDKQVEMFQTALDKKPAAICLAAVDSKAFQPLLEKAKAAGIPVVGFDSGVDSDIPVTTAATDNIAAAAMAADKMAELIGGVPERTAAQRQGPHPVPRRGSAAGELSDPGQGQAGGHEPVRLPRRGPAQARLTRRPRQQEPCPAGAGGPRGQGGTYTGLPPMNANGPYDRLLSKIAGREAVVGVVGLGYVGLPLAHAFHEAGLRVLGFDSDPGKIRSLSRGESYLRHLAASVFEELHGSERFEATGEFSRLSEADAVLVCVPTPLGRHHEPDLSYVVSAAKLAGAALREGQLIVLVSTTYPGTTRADFLPALAGAVTVWLAGMIAKRLGGGCFTTILIFLLLWWLLGHFKIFQ